MSQIKILTEDETCWSEHIKAQEHSGLSQRKYCLQYGIGYKAFLYHRYKAQGKLKTKKPILNFIEAKPKLVAPPPVAETLQLILPNGVKMGVPPQIDTTLLKAVMTIAAAL